MTLNKWFLFSTKSNNIFDNVVYNDKYIFAFKVIAIISAVFLLRLATKQVMYLIVERILKTQGYPYKAERNKRKNTLVSGLNTIMTILYSVVALIFILHEFGIKLSSLVTAFGALGVIIGIAGQSIIKDFLRGLSILFYDQMRVGDVVDICQKIGKIEAIYLLTTKLRDLDGNMHFVPNGEITTVTNKTNAYANVNLNINIAYKNDIDSVEKICNEVGQKLAESEEWADKIIEPIKFVRVNDFGDVSVEIKLVGKVMPGEQWQAAGEYRRRLKKSFEQNKISIPYPQLVLNKDY